MKKALIVFSDNSGAWWLKLLKPGYRHCFAMVETDRGILWVDPLSNSLTLKILEGYELNALVRWYRETGLKVVNVPLETTRRKPFCWAPMTCVEVVKRLVGIRDPFIVTPWQLYRLLNRTKSENIGKNELTSV